MSYNKSRQCRCSHRHHPGKCPHRACGCDELRPDPRGSPLQEVPPHVIRDGELVSWGPVLYPPWTEPEDSG